MIINSSEFDRSAGYNDSGGLWRLMASFKEFLIVEQEPFLKFGIFLSI